MVRIERILSDVRMISIRHEVEDTETLSRIGSRLRRNFSQDSQSEIPQRLEIVSLATKGSPWCTHTSVSFVLPNQRGNLAIRS